MSERRFSGSGSSRLFKNALLAIGLLGFLSSANTNSCSIRSESVPLAKEDNEESGGLERLSELVPNPGVFSFVQGGVHFEWVVTSGATVEIKSDGKVKLDVPVSKKSHDGRSDCFPYILYGSFDQYLSQKDQSALLGDGLELPDGATSFVVVYVAAANVDDLLGNIQKYLIKETSGGTASAHSAQAEAVIFSRTPEVRKLTAGKFEVPLDVQRASWLSLYHFSDHSLGNPVNNKFGITRYYVNNDPNKQFGKHYTHLQYTHGWMDGVTPAHKWRNKQDVHKNDVTWLVENEQYHKDYIVFAEIAENNQTGQPGYDKSEQVFAGMYEELKKRDHTVKSPADTRFYGDYFAHLHNGGLSVPLHWSTEAEGKRMLSNQSEARKTRHGESLQTSGYFSNGYYNHRNILHPAYMSNLVGLSPRDIYNLIFNMEKYNLAAPDRRVGLMTTPMREGLQLDLVTDFGVWYTLPLQGGKAIQRVSSIPHQFESMFTQAFWAYLVGNQTDVVIWDSNVKLSTNPRNFVQSWYGGPDTWKTRYKAPDGTVVEYNPGNPAHPQRVRSDEGEFPEAPQHGEVGTFAARLLIRQITEDLDLVSRGLFYGRYTYKVNGGKPINGYRSGSTPQGSVDGRLSARGFSNPGQHNIVELLHDRKPIYVKGLGESGAVHIFQNPWASVSDETSFLVDGKTYSVKGNGIHVFRE